MITVIPDWRAKLERKFALPIAVGFLALGASQALQGNWCSALYAAVTVGLFARLHQFYLRWNDAYVLEDSSLVTVRGGQTHRISIDALTRVRHVGLLGERYPGPVGGYECMVIEDSQGRVVVPSAGHPGIVMEVRLRLRQGESDRSDADRNQPHA